jgi:hypothetical protein
MNRETCELREMKTKQGLIRFTAGMRRSYTLFFRGLVILSRIVLKISTRMVRQPHGGRVSFADRERTWRRGRRLCPVGSPVIILRTGFCSHLFNLVRSKSGVPNYLPSQCKTLQVDQAVSLGGLSIPPIIANLDFRSLRFNDAHNICGQCLDPIDSAVFFTQFGELSFVAAPSPAIKKDDKQCSKQHYKRGSNRGWTTTMLCTNHTIHHGRRGGYEYDSEQLDERICPLRQAVIPM